MDAKTMLDMATKLITRQDVDRALLLMFLNVSRKALLRSNDIAILQQYLPNVTITAGAVDLSTLKIKAVKTVFYKVTSEEKKLIKLDSREDAVNIFPEMGKTGDPSHYFIEGLILYVLPVPTGGQINLVAEVWPDDLTDSDTSSDITTTEIPAVLFYLAASMYLDHFDEYNKSQVLYNTGIKLFGQYQADSEKNAAYDVYHSAKGYF